RTGEGTIVGHRVELAALRGDGSEVPVDMTISAVPDGDAWVFHAFIQDISDRKRLESSLEGTEQRFEATLGALAEAVTIRDRSDRIVYANPPALRQLGFASMDELRAAPPGGIMDQFVVEGEDGRPLTMDDVPSVRIFRGEHPEPLVMRIVHRATGREQWLVLKSTPLRDAAGEIEAAVTVIE